MTDELNEQDALLAELQTKEFEALNDAEKVEYLRARGAGWTHPEAIELVKDTSDEPAGAVSDITEVPSDEPVATELPTPEREVVVEPGESIVEKLAEVPAPTGINDHVAYDAPVRGEN